MSPYQWPPDLVNERIHAAAFCQTTQCCFHQPLSIIGMTPHPKVLLQRLIISKIDSFAGHLLPREKLLNPWLEMTTSDTALEESH